ALATLHRLEDLHPLPVAQLELVPLAAGDHLAIDGHGHAAAFGLGAAGGHRVEHARVLAQLTRLAVQAHLHPRLPTTAEELPTSMRVTIVAVIGASSTPLR